MKVLDILDKCFEGKKLIRIIRENGLFTRTEQGALFILLLNQFKADHGSPAQV